MDAIKAGYWTGLGEDDTVSPRWYNFNIARRFRDGILNRSFDTNEGFSSGYGGVYIERVFIWTLRYSSCNVGMEIVSQKASAILFTWLCWSDMDLGCQRHLDPLPERYLLLSFKQIYNPAFLLQDKKDFSQCCNFRPRELFLITSQFMLWKLGLKANDCH
jgi:hypothetical protein